MESNSDATAMIIRVPNSGEQLRPVAMALARMRSGFPCVPTTMIVIRERDTRLTSRQPGAVANDWSRRSSTSSQNPFRSSCTFASFRFDTRLYLAPVRGNSAALRHSVFCFTSCPAGSGSSPKKLAQTAKNAEQISFGSLRKSRPSALGSRAHSRGFAMCAPSKSGAQNGEQTCI